MLLQLFVIMFGLVCEKMKIKVNIKKVRLWLLFGRKVLSVRVNGKPLEEVNCLVYLGMEVAANGRMESELWCKVGVEIKGFGTLKSICKVRNISIEAKVILLETIVATAVSIATLYSWGRGL